MSELATVEIERARGILIARIAGEIDASNATRIQVQVLEAVANEGVGVVLDLTQTDYIDSAGVRVLFDVGERLQVRGMELRLVAPRESFTADLLGTVQMAERFAVDDARDAAVEALLERMPRERAPE